MTLGKRSAGHMGSGPVRPRQCSSPVRLLVAGLALAAFLLPVAPAQAAPFPPRLNFAYDLAIRYWGMEPPACASIDRQIVPGGSLGDPLTGAISGYATQVPADAPPASMSCVLWIDRAYAEPIIFDFLCAVMIHNVGHLQGYEDSPDRQDVMNESIPVPPLCALKGRESIRLYFLRMRFHRLQARRGAKVTRLRRRLRRELQAEATRFWALES